jgi:hypothetical protein
MGIDTGLRLRWAASGSCKQFWGDAPVVHNRAVIIHDLLTSLFTARGPNHNYMYTGTEFSQNLLDYARIPLNVGAATVVILCADNAKYVPTQKKKEQSRRDSDAKVQPYPDCAEFCQAGVFIQGTESELDLRRVMRNRSLRAKLFRYAVNLWTTGNYRTPKGCTFIFDHFTEGAYVFDSHKAYTTKVPLAGFGEADLKLPFWVTRYASTGQDIIVNSTDSDLIPILVHTVTALGDKITSKVILKYWKLRWVDVRGVAAYVNTTLNMTSAEFIVACIMCGSDYVDKKLVFFYLGCNPLFDIFETITDKLVPAAESKEGMHELVRASYAVVSSGLGTVYADEKNPTMDELRQQNQGKVAASARSKGSKRRRVAPPSDEGIDSTFDSMSFNLNYWTVDWASPRFPKVPVSRTDGGQHSEIVHRRPETIRSRYMARQRRESAAQEHASRTYVSAEQEI